MKKMWNDLNPYRQKRNRLILRYVVLTIGSFLLQVLAFVIADVAGIPKESVSFFAILCGLLLGLLLPFVFWMVGLTRRAKAWDKDQRAMAEAITQTEQLRHKREEPPKQPELQAEAPGELDDVSYIKEMHHTRNGPWQQYDVLLDARPYGWKYMVDEIDELVKADLDGVDTLRVAAGPGEPEQDLIVAYRAAGSRAANVAQLANEGSTLAVGGLSRTLGGPVMVVLFNQTNLLRFFVISENEDRVRRYAETLVRRSFNTPDAMKLGRPHADEKS